LIERLSVGVLASIETTDVRGAWSSVITLLLRLAALRLSDSELFIGERARSFCVAGIDLDVDGVDSDVDGVDFYLDAVDFDEDAVALLDSVLSVFDKQVALSALYEMVLNMVPARRIDTDGPKLVAVRLDKSKKRGGQFYSPPELVEDVVDRALAPLVKTTPVSDLKIVDPAMGAGVFIIHAFRFLAKHHKGSRTELARQCLYGVDLDPLAVEVARLSLWLEVGDFSCEPSSTFSNLRVGNSLIGCTADAFSTKFELDKACASWFCGDSSDFRREAKRESLTNDRVAELKRKHKFFHWEHEFPEVFHRPNPGFDAVIGNPPWEIEKPNSREFFGMVDPSYWALGKQEALEAQQKLLNEDPSVAAAWQERINDYKFFSRWIRNAPVQFAAEAAHPFQQQGSGDLNLYKLFSEQSFYLAREDGIVSLIVPSGIYSDSGAGALRSLFLSKARWTDLVGYENWDATFDIHRSFKYCVFVVRKGGATDNLTTTFNGQNCEYKVKGLKLLSPRWSVIPEIENEKVLAVLQNIFRSSTLLGDIEYGGKPLTYSREFDMTLDSNKFRGRDELEARGFIQDIYGNWLSGKWRERSSTAGDIGGGASVSGCGGAVVSVCGGFAIDPDKIADVFLPLYEGRMVGQFTANEKQWIGGKGRRAEWRQTSLDDCGTLGPQYLIRRDDVSSRADLENLKLGFLAVGCATNARTMIATSLSGVPCGNSVPTLACGPSATLSDLTPTEFQLALSACLNSLVFDFVIRRKMAGNNLNYFVIEECPVPNFNGENVAVLKRLAKLVSLLSLNHHRFSRELLELGFNSVPKIRRDSDRAREIRTCIDVLVAHLYGLSFEEVRTLLAEPEAEGRRNPKGFHRIDRELPFEKRLPQRVLHLARESVSSVLQLVDDLVSCTENQNDCLHEHASVLNFLLHNDRSNRTVDQGVKRR